MIVVAIIGILAAIAIPNFIKFQAKAKQSEANSQLKAIFSAQKANFPLLGGYWSDVGAIGFSPERGNRYLYNLGATAATVAAGTIADCANADLADRSAAAAMYVPPAGTCGVEADVDRHGATFAAATLRALAGANAAPSAFVPNGTNAALTGVGVPNLRILPVLCGLIVLLLVERSVAEWVALVRARQRAGRPRGAPLVPRAPRHLQALAYPGGLR